jgi:hypothetical protein
MKVLCVAAVFASALALEESASLMPQEPDVIPHDQCAVTVGMNENERLEVFALGMDNAIFHSMQVAANSYWSPWESLGGNFSSGPTVVRNVDGRLEVFSRGEDDDLYHKYQYTPNGEKGWSPWLSLGGKFSSAPTVLLNSEGTLQVFARGKENRALMYNGQTHNVSGVFWSGWQNLGGILTSGPTAVLTAESLVHVFVRGIDKGLFEKREVANHLTGVSWSRWESLGGVLSSHPAVPTVLNPVNLLEIFVRQADKAIWHKKQLATTTQPYSVQWSDWQSLGGKHSSGPSVILSGEGLLEVFSRGQDKSIFWKRQKAHDSPEWTNWETLGGESSTGPAAFMNPEGRLELFIRGTDKAVWHKWRTTGPAGKNVSWSDWVSLGGTFRNFPC